MRQRDSLGIAIISLMAASYGGQVTSETCGPEIEYNEDRTPWKLRLHGANKDRRAARKKRTKKLNRRR